MTIYANIIVQHGAILHLDAVSTIGIRPTIDPIRCGIPDRAVDDGTRSHIKAYAADGIREDAVSDYRTAGPTIPIFVNTMLETSEVRMRN
eukprot:CAMPEP_0174350572 /NCGR_PEP_ID=MMETSP0811_2-20130205/7692_1 /TAXON_ID=73025 ORGANISM="Eutreptiella gymnastica-like, Strain CCMP1594" /NCGR_SAMPLE_ID=MMETSP0811_2 /ASSEMBLY_ACC=CAM_ASM_000667 /LENGTH=89 /DNA_ID=CAMNT_0015479009 /DNA_START=363 /DNA_END=632 /DNA_ORIENTATION=-